MADLLLDPDDHWHLLDEIKRSADLDDGRVTMTEAVAFDSMRTQLEERGRLTKKQIDWLHDVCARLGVIGAAPARNVFSAMPEDVQREHLARAAKVKINSGAKVLRPPTRRTDG